MPGVLWTSNVPVTADGSSSKSMTLRDLATIAEASKGRTKFDIKSLRDDVFKLARVAKIVELGESELVMLCTHNWIISVAPDQEILGDAAWVRADLALGKTARVLGFGLNSCRREVVRQVVRRPTDVVVSVVFEGEASNFLASGFVVRSFAEGGR